MIKTKLTQMFAIKYPIISAPMFLVSNTKMVVATGKAGGLGSFPALNFRPIENYRKAIQDIKKQTKAPFGINIIVQQSNKSQHEQLDIALEEKTPLIITSLGNPKKTIELAHQVGTKVFCDVVDLKYAKKVQDLGADGVIAVAGGAGGHAGNISPFALIPYLKDHLKIPVIAAGSIVDGRGMLAALSLGADGIYMGTRFIASKECDVPLEYKKAIQKAGCEDIVNTDRVDGFPGNFIKTPSLTKLGLEPGFMENFLSQSKKLKRWMSLARAAKSLFSPEKMKASYKTVFSAGHGVGLIDKTETIDQIIEKTVKEYHQLKKKLPD